MTKMVTCQSTNLTMTQTLNPRIRAGNLLPLSALHLSGGARLIRSNPFTICVVYLLVAINFFQISTCSFWGAILCLLQILFSLVFGYGNVVIHCITWKNKVCTKDNSL